MTEKQEYNKFMKTFVKNICEIQKEYENLSPNVKYEVNLEIKKAIDFYGIDKTLQCLIEKHLG